MVGRKGNGTIDPESTGVVSEEVWKVVVSGEALAGVAAVRDGETTLVVYNICEMEKNVSYYVESSVTDVVRKKSGGRWSR